MGCRSNAGLRRACLRSAPASLGARRECPGRCSSSPLQDSGTGSSSAERFATSIRYGLRSRSGTARKRSPAPVPPHTQDVRRRAALAKPHHVAGLDGARVRNCGSPFTTGFPHLRWTARGGATATVCPLHLKRKEEERAKTARTKPQEVQRRCDCHRQEPHLSGGIQDRGVDAAL